MNRMKEILERYWDCQTSTEEEQLLREWFSQGNVPDELKQYRSAFLLQMQMADQKADPSLCRNVLNAIENETIKAHKSFSFYSMIKIAASILVIVSMGIGIFTHYQQEKFLKEMFIETYTDPEDALKETRAVLDKVSSSFFKAQKFFNELQPGVAPDSVPDTSENDDSVIKNNDSDEEI